jgi:c-di-AMP phosphodiesterase-like protein
MLEKLKKLIFSKEDETRIEFDGLHFPLPTVMINTLREVVWYNSYFDDAVSSIDDFREKISHVNLDFEKPVSFPLTVGDKDFEVVGKVTQSDAGDESVILYLIDRTDRRIAANNLINNVSAFCILMIDNYDDLIKSLSAQEDKISPTAVASQIDTLVTSWVEDNHGMMMKYEKDKYFAIIKNQELISQKQVKFAFFEEFNEINGGRLPVTLSVGIGYSMGTISESFDYAKDALDMAQGRGGDQIVIRDDAGFKYFGGRSIDVEKRTKVKPRLVADALLKLLQKADGVFLMGHKKADNDSFGAMVGIAAMMRAANLECHIVLDEDLNCKQLVDLLMPLPEYRGMFITAARALEMATEDSLTFLVDCHRASMSQESGLLDICDVVLIDHHRRDSDFYESAVLTYHEPFASSTCEMIVEILQYFEPGVHLLKEEVQAMYAGIVLDTKNFTFKTGVRTFEAASYLKICGADPIFVKRLFQVPQEEYVRRVKAIASADIYKGVAICKLPAGAKSAEVSQCADSLLSLDGAVASVAMSQDGDAVSISARSYGSINVQVLMEALGGGGHMMSSGAQFHGTMKEVITKIKETLDNGEDV